MPNYTRTQRRILDMLSDGEPHTAEELLVCLNDELSAKVTVQVHVSMIRKIMKQENLCETIVCETAYRRFFYRHVRLIRSRE